MYINLIIPLYNSNYIEKQLLSIKKITIKKNIIRIIFIDDWSNIRYRNKYKYIINNFKKEIINNFEVIYFYLWKKKWQNRVCKARNKWVELSIWENLYFIDQETILTKNIFLKLQNYIKYNDIFIWPYLWYNNIKKNINESDINFFIENWFINKVNFDDFRSNYYKEKQEKNRIWEFFCGSNFFIKKNIYLDIWWFDETLISWWDEDVEFAYRLQKKWYKIIYDEEFKVLNLSKKLYNEPYNILEKDKIDLLSENWLKNYEKHNYSREYKRYILDRFFSFKYNEKIKVNKNFVKYVLNNDYYLKKRKKIVFFRLDDVKELNLNLKILIKIFINYNIPLILWIEPWNIDKKTIDYLNNIKNKYPKLFDIIQHWYKHNNNSDCWNKYEFWDSRTYIKQFQDIEKWYNFMQDNFKINFLKWFIPPYNNININTEKIIESMNFKIFSSGYPYENYLWSKDIISLPFYLDIIKNYSWNIEYKDFLLIKNEIDFYIERDNFVWILLHPQFFSDDIFILLLKIIKYCNKIDTEKLSFTDYYKLYKNDFKKT